MNARMLAGCSALALSLIATEALGQVDLSGNWQITGPYVQLIINGPAPGDFSGVPLNEDGRAAAATADPNQESEELSRQCQNWLVNYYVDGVFGMELRPVADSLNGNRILAWRLEGSFVLPPLVIWLDGRPAPPPQALHTWAGFATGQWHGSTLAVSITHIKDGWLQRNGAPESNQETVQMFLAREGNMLTETFIIHDPVYLSEAYPQARTFVLSEASQSFDADTVENCLPAEVLPGFSDGYHAARYLPGQNPLLSNSPAENFMLKAFHMPPQIALGGAQQMYPEYRKVLKRVYSPPPGYCTLNCCTGNGNGTITTCPAPAPVADSRSGVRDSGR